MGKWLPGRVQRIGRDGEVDLILDDGTELENVPEERLRMPKATAMKRASSWDCLEALAKDNHLRRGKVGKEPRLIRVKLTNVLLELLAIERIQRQ